MLCVAQELYFSADAAGTGMTMVSAYQLWSQPHEEPPWKDVVPHFRHLTARELDPFEAAGGPDHALMEMD